MVKHGQKWLNMVKNGKGNFFLLQNLPNWLKLAEYSLRDSILHNSLNYNQSHPKLNFLTRCNKLFISVLVYHMQVGNDKD